MRIPTFIAGLGILLATTATAIAADQPFRGITSELTTTKRDAPFQIDPPGPRSDRLQPQIALDGADSFYKSTVLSGRRAQATRGTGLPLVDRLLGTD
ncbi:MAG: hypothetical protein AAGK00_19515 [Pseudomonadota bacterium]